MGNSCGASSSPTGHSVDSDIVRPPPTPRVQEQVPPSPTNPPRPAEEQQQQQPPPPPPTTESAAADRYSARSISPSSTSPSRSPVSAPISSITGPVGSSSSSSGSATPPTAATDSAAPPLVPLPATTAVAAASDSEPQTALEFDEDPATSELHLGLIKWQSVDSNPPSSNSSSSSTSTSFRHLLNNSSDSGPPQPVRLASESLPSINSDNSMARSFGSDDAPRPTADADTAHQQQPRRHIRRVVQPSPLKARGSPFLKGSPMPAGASAAFAVSPFEQREPAEEEVDRSSCAGSSISSQGTSVSSRGAMWNGDDEEQQQQQEEEEGEGNVHQEAVMMSCPPHEVVNAQE